MEITVMTYGQAVNTKILMQTSWYNTVGPPGLKKMDLTTLSIKSASNLVHYGNICLLSWNKRDDYSGYKNVFS
jgi:hypothetical protein